MDRPSLYHQGQCNDAGENRLVNLVMIDLHGATLPHAVEVSVVVTGCVPTFHRESYSNAKRVALVRHGGTF
jgi:hypothetical protein